MNTLYNVALTTITATGLFDLNLSEHLKEILAIVVISLMISLIQVVIATIRSYIDKSKLEDETKQDLNDNMELLEEHLIEAIKKKKEQEVKKDGDNQDTGRAAED